MGEDFFLALVAGLLTRAEARLFCKPKPSAGLKTRFPGLKVRGWAHKKSA
jgi:hypothetical protein